MAKFGEMSDLARRMLREPRASGWTALSPGFQELTTTERRRYIVAPLLYQQAAGETARSSLGMIHRALRDRIVRGEQETGPKVLRLSPLEASLLKMRFPGLLVEPDVRHAPARTPLCPPLEPLAVPAARAKTLRIEVTGNGAPVAGARVLVFTDDPPGSGYEGVTAADGTLQLPVRARDFHYPRLFVIPASGFWSRELTGVLFQGRIGIALKPLKVRGFDWGLRATGAEARGGRAGEGVKVAVVDSGIGPHPGLRVAGGRNLIVGEDSEAWRDLDGHGTHCAGILAANPWGYAPAASLYALRVFGGPDGGGFASDIGDAIEWAVEAGCDIVSLSFTSETPSRYLQGKIEKATDRGVLCVAAAGNGAGEVGYPAGFRHVVGVSAIGKTGTFPADSVHAEALGAVRGQDGFFFASFSNHGEEIDLCAPGVAVTSTVLGEGFAAWDGTSAACPHIAGVAALALAASPAIREARGGERMGLLYDRLLGLCADLDMPLAYQGSGLPKLGPLFA